MYTPSIFVGAFIGLFLYTSTYRYPKKKNLNFAEIVSSQVKIVLSRVEFKSRVETHNRFVNRLFDVYYR